MVSELTIKTRSAAAGGAAGDCSILGSLELLGDYWTLGILRTVLYGETRFGRIEAELGVATNVLSSRLRSLVEAGVLERSRYRERPERFEYLLTERGEELTPILLGLKTWGDRHLRDGEAASVVRHEGCEGPLEFALVCPDCGERVERGALVVEPAEGARTAAADSHGS